MFIMNEGSEFSETSVENILKSTPKAVRLFLDRHTACVGCGFARFCTLKDVINTYQLDEKLFIEELTKIVIQKY
jgi:succinylglutamate desuccinylase